MILISPTEHSQPIRQLGSVSSLCEQNGVDILSVSTGARIGFQRKEVKDFFASLQDGRLQKELLQIECSQLLTHAVLILEGNFDWTTDGESTSQYSRINRSSFRNIIASIQLQGIIVEFTDSAEDTAYFVLSLTKYLSKKSHSGLSRRPNAVSGWGKTTTRSFALHLLQSFPAIGPELANRIYDYYHGVPIAWSTNAKELQQVPGIGPIRARELIAALDRGDSADEGTV